MQFEIRLISTNWIKNVDDPKDLCAHGKVFVRIGNEIIMDDSDGDDWTVSAAALNLMRTVYCNYTPGDFSSQLIPCCGFNMYAINDERNVDIIGCPNGFDWSIKHQNGKVHHVTAKGVEGVIDISEYIAQVIAFTNKVQTFYKQSSDKTLPTDEIDREGYIAFWAEWEDLHQKLIESA